MVRMLTVRALQSIGALILASMAIFALVRLVPGDPAAVIAGTEASPEVLAQVRAEQGLDEPLPVQYAVWVGNLFQGDLGQSYTARRPVSGLIEPTIGPTIFLLIAGVAVAIVVALGLGVAAAVAKRRGVDALLMSLAAFLYGAPVFWLGLLMILVFAVSLGWFPTGGYVPPSFDPLGALRSLVLPGLVLGLAMGAALSRFVRTSFLETLEADHVRLARAKGASTFQVLRKHTFRNALVPVVTVFGVAFAGLLGGAVVIEQVFTWPGLGTLMVNSVNARDYPTVQAVMLIYVGVFIVVNFLTDLSYSLIDPRIRVTGGAA